MGKKLDLKLDIKEIKQYDAASVEKEIFSYWEENGFFKPEAHKRSKKEDRFTIILPPPNANGNLHLGHASGYSYQDLMGRYNRMLGRETLLLPGKDHAGIQTEVVFEKELAKKGKRKKDIGREAFYDQAYEFSMMNSAIARGQERRLGLSADYERELFTLDPRIKKTVFETFVSMYNDGLIYRGKRIINWCVRCQTALADIDTEAKNEDGFLYYIEFGPFVIATTRPETKLADTAIAVNPKDKRYQKYIDTEVEIHSVEGTYKLPVIGDYTVDPEFGTGVLKVTPGHSVEDFRIAQNHNLPIKTVIDQYGKMAANTGKYAGMKVLEARDAIVKDLDEMGLLVKTEKINHNIRVCERCKGVIEPLISYQWFIKMEDLKANAIKALTDGKIHFHPKRQEKNCLHWLQIPEDWCISRQLWWGYQIPAWYCGGKNHVIDKDGNVEEVYGSTGGCGKIIVSTNKPENCPYCGKKNLVQDEDVLDTWYSSGQWPYATLLAHDADFERYFPTQVMETGRDIIFFWVARMIMLSLYKYNEVPFSDVYLHGIVLDKDGKKQSKSKGNGIDPMQEIEKFGADALRLSFIVGNAPDQDYRLYEEKIRGFRNFINKIWNASRFIMLQLDSLEDMTQLLTTVESLEKGDYRNENETLSLHNAHLKTMRKLMDSFRFGRAGDEIYTYFWHRFCDIDIEHMKKEIQDHPENKEENLGILVYILLTELKVLHPFVPFITEYIWHILGEYGIHQEESETIMYSRYPVIA